MCMCSHFVQRVRGGYPEVRHNFVASVFAVLKGDCVYEFHLSDKFEPYAIAIVIHRDRGKLIRLSKTHVQDLESAVRAFKHKYGIVNERYHYTPYAERMETDSFVKQGVCVCVSVFV